MASTNNQEILSIVRLRALDVLGEEHFEHWLNTRKRALGNQVPLDLAKTKGGSEQVFNLLGRIEHGVFC
ncbi:MbcA/ParS/Xre antitoxin family protein [Methylophaga nitratireducenticrescens]|uniref:MbcA/ParS/Xre antitoxin family protein n=1 Tax=Methylophaga nitratireducenticrescens TaxID=754476 RepID=UPI00146C04D4|nr:MbcA/ParS/Xre antitoxin family protein [Methylophaga nitratireducenticrescens]